MRGQTQTSKTPAKKAAPEATLSPETQKLLKLAARARKSLKGINIFPQSEQEEQADYQAWYINQVQQGLDDLDNGRVVSHADFLADMEKRLTKLEKKHGIKAA